jgi:Flp pilus assembly protein TadB
MAFWKKKKPKPVHIPFERQPVTTSREYRLFKRKTKTGLNWYETLANLSGKLLRFRPGRERKIELLKAINFTQLRVRPSSVMSLMLLTIIFFAALGIILAAAGLIPIIGGLLVGVFGILLGYYLYRYPFNLMKEMRIKASSQVILAVLYMVVSMRLSPNLERALRFAASNITGPLAWDMRKLIWDIEMRKYASAWDAMDDYIAKWKPENEEFAEAMRLVRDSTTQMPDKAKGILDEALNIVLDGSKTRMKHYVQDLKMPVMMIHMMGIVLPVLGSIMAPLVAVFMADLAQWWHFVLGYNIILPIVIIWFINSILRKRPITFSPSIPGSHPIMQRTNLPVLLLSVVILTGFLIIPLTFFYQNPKFLASGITGDQSCILFSMAMENCSLISLVASAVIILGVSAALSVYFILSNSRKVKLYTRTKSIEGEFELALFQLGNRISGGVPTEVAVDKSIGDVKDLEISNLFKRALKNMRTLGMTFESALFDKKFGALKYYPSKLIKSIMRAVVDTAKKGVAYASDSMFRISSYLKSIRETQEYIREMLEETVSSMKFQAYFLTPMVTGLVVSMADIIMLVLGRLGTYLDKMDLAGDYGAQVGFTNFTQIFGNLEASMSPSVFQLIVGTYLVQVILILAIFITKISEGENKPLQWYTAGRMLIVGVVMYFLIALISTSVFHSFIEQSLSGLGVL